MEQLTTEMIMVMMMIGVAIFLFIVEWLRVDVVAILIMVSLPLLVLVTPAEAIKGFSSNAVISIIAVIIIGAGLDKTGVINRIVTPIIKLAGKSQSRIVTLISMTVAIISSFMQNIGAAALFLPALQRISKSLKIPLSRILMPVGFSAILGGTVTLVGSSPLILLNDLLQPFKLESFQLFYVSPIGLALVISGIAFFVFFGRFVLPKGEVKEQEGAESVSDLTSIYENIEGPFELSVPEDFTHYREPVTIQGIFDIYAVRVVAISEPPDLKIMPPFPDMEIRSNRDIVVYGFEKDVKRMAEKEGMELKESLDVFKEAMSEARSGTVEAVVAPRSHMINKTFNEVNFQEKYKTNPIAIYRSGQVFYSVLEDMPLEVGDAILLQGDWKHLKILQREKDLIFSTPVDVEETRPEKAVFASVWLAIALVMIIVFKFQLSICLLTGALGMIITKVLNIDEAYESVDWRTIFLLAGLIPLGVATENTGTAKWIAETVLGMIGNVSPIVLLSVIAILSTFFTLVISNVGATVLLVPLVVNMAIAAGMDAQGQRMAALVVGIATSNSFMLPTHQVNALYMGPGRYRSVDYMKAGSIESILFIIVLIGMIYLFYI